MDLDTLVPYQYRKATFTKYPDRQNGWQRHQILFNSNVEETVKLPEQKVFRYDADTTRVHVLRDGFILKFEMWWKGRAPWGYHQVLILRNIQDEHIHPVKNEPIDIPSCSLSKEECDAKHRRPSDGDRMLWSCHECGRFESENGHISFREDSVLGDTYLPFNTPAHIQGTPGIFELSIAAYEKELYDRIGDLCTSDDSVNALLELVRNNAEPALVEMHLKSFSYSNTHRNNEVGETAIEILIANENRDIYQQDPKRLSQMKNLLCINSFAHATFSSSNLSTNTSNAHERCWRCKAFIKRDRAELERFDMNRTLQEDESLFGRDICSNPPNEAFENASLAALNRGVDIKWLEKFTDYHNCWAWPTWRVVQNIIKPATAHSRVRYVDLPGVSSAANVGRVNIFISHAWGGCFGGKVCISFELELA